MCRVLDYHSTACPVIFDFFLSVNVSLKDLCIDVLVEGVCG